MSQMSKLQIRAKVLSVVSEIKSIPSFSSDLLNDYIEDLSQISDMETLFDIFIKEYIKMGENECFFLSCLIKELVSKEYVTDKVFESLKSPSLSDESKYKLVQLLRIVGGNCDYEDIPSYFDNPEEVLDLETKKLLERAVFNPESMLDFLDFVSAVSQKDRKLLLDSLSVDYKGDVLANIIYPILYSDFSDDFILSAINVLAESKSSLAISPFEYLIQTSENKEIVDACNLGLKKLKLSGASKEKADEYYKNIIKDTIPAELFATVPDGNGNQAILISRLNQDKKYLLGAFVINDIFGIIDCFGFFNISQDELIKVVGKFYQNEGKYKVSPEYVRFQIDKAVELTIKNKRKFPYEFICWSPLFADFDILDSLSVEQLKTKLLSTDELLTLLTKDYTFRWYITSNDNSNINSLVDNIYNLQEFDIEKVNSFVKDYTEIVFDENMCGIWKSRLNNLIYLLCVNSEKNIAEKFYSLLNNDDLFSVFKSVIMQRSLFNCIYSLYQNSKDSFFTANIFKKRNSVEAKYDSKKLMTIIENLQVHWLNE